MCVCQQTLKNRSPSGSLGESERGNLCLIQENSEGGIRDELGNGTLGMFKCVYDLLFGWFALCFWPGQHTDCWEPEWKKGAVLPF